MPATHATRKKAPPDALKRMRKALLSAAPAKLVGRGRYRGFARLHVDGKRRRVGRKLSGLTKRLEERVYSKGALPAIARRALMRREEAPASTPRSWRGKQGGRRRGMAVDGQITAIANGRKPRQGIFRLTKIALTALKAAGLRPVCGQLPVVSDCAGVATAIDLVAMRPSERGPELLLIELKTGYDQGRTLPALRGGVEQRMAAPLEGASDCVCHRHLAQLAATTALFLSDPAMGERLEHLGVVSVHSALLYLTDQDIEWVPMQEWWLNRGAAIVEACGAQ